MSNGTPYDLDLTDIYSAGRGPVPALQLKVDVADQSPLSVEAAYRESSGLFATILATVIADLGGTVSALIPGGAFATAAVSGFLGFIGDRLKSASGGKHVQSIGQGTLRIKVGDLTTEPQDFAVALTAPEDVPRTWLVQNPDEAARGDEPYVFKTENVLSHGDPNGTVLYSIYKLD